MSVTVSSIISNQNPHKLLRKTQNMTVPLLKITKKISLLIYPHENWMLEKRSCNIFQGTVKLYDCELVSEKSMTQSCGHTEILRQQEGEN